MSLDLLGLVAGLFGVIAAVLLPVEWGVLAILLVQQMPWAGEVVSAGGVAVRPPDMAAMTWMLRAWLHVRRNGLDLAALRTAPAILAAGWAAWVLIATTVAHVREGDLHGGAQLVGLVRLYGMMLVLPFTAVVLSAARPDRVKGLVALIAAAAGVQALAAFSRWAPAALLRVDWIESFGFTEQDRWFLGRDPVLAFPISRGGRWTGSFGDPAAFGDLMVVGAAAAWAVARAAAHRTGWILGSVCIAAAGLSVTRASWAGLAALGIAGWFMAAARPAERDRTRWVAFLASGLVVWVLLLSAESGSTWLRAWRGRNQVSSTVATVGEPAGAAGGAPGIAPAVEPPAATAPPPSSAGAGYWLDGLRSRLRLRADRSVEGRQQMIRLDLEQFAAHPIVGVGWTGARFHGLDLPWGEPLYTRLLAETGLAGLLLFLMMLAAGARSAWRGLVGIDGGATALAWFSGLGLAAFMGFMVADLLILGPSLGSAILFLLLGSAAAAEQRAAAAVDASAGSERQALC